MRVAILRCENLPLFVTWEIPDINVFFQDDFLLMEEFRKKGVQADHVVWSDPLIVWNEYDVALIRSTWDYIDRCEEFLKVLEKIDASTCTLYNPLDVVKWNTDKHYLPDLEKLGISIVPTFLLDMADTAFLRDTFLQKGWNFVVTKPTIGGGGAGVTRLSTTDMAYHCQQLQLQHPDTPFIIQPLIESVITEGEWSYFIIGGEIAHVVLKKPATGDYRAHGIYGGTLERKIPDESDIQQVKLLLHRLPFEFVYARVDLVRIEDQLSVMELELIEPMFYFEFHPPAAEQFVTAVLNHFERSN